MEYVDHIYEIIKKETEGLDSVYEDYILHLVGWKGLLELQKHHLVETCGIMRARRLYVICDRKE